MVMIIVAFMLQSMIRSPLYYVTLLFIGTIFFMFMYRAPDYAPDRAPQQMSHREWGYGWKPSWNSVQGEPLPEPKIEKPPAPLVVSTHQK